MTIQEVLGIEKLLTLRNAKEMNLFFPELKQLEYLGEIAQKTSLYKVAVPWNLNRLHDVYSAIIEHQRNIKET